MSKSSCAICKTSYRNENVKFIHVPKKVSKREKWSQVCGIDFKESSKLCERHFLESDFKIVEEQAYGKRRRLMPNAIPSVNLPSKFEVEPEIDYVKQSQQEYELFDIESVAKQPQFESGSQTESETIDSGIILENMRLSSLVKKLQTENAQLNAKLSQANNFNKSLKKFFSESQIKKLMNPGKRFRWTTEDIADASELYAAGPGAYIYLYERGYPIPCIQSIIKKMNPVESASETVEMETLEMEAIERLEDDDD